jgi:hypothetical protein
VVVCGDVGRLGVMSFLDAVRALRQELGVPETMAVPDAVRHMSELMGLPVKNDAGAILSLPAQVEQLNECLGVAVPLEKAAANGEDVREGEGDASDDADEDSLMEGLPSSPSLSSGEKKQRESPPCFFTFALSALENAFCHSLAPLNLRYLSALRHYRIVFRARAHEEVREGQACGIGAQSRATKARTSSEGKSCVRVRPVFHARPCISYPSQILLARASV